MSSCPFGVATRLNGLLVTWKVVKRSLGSAAEVIAIQQVHAPFFASGKQQMTIGDGQRTA